jgi:hypothetical protein
LKHDSDLQFILSKTGIKKITRDGSVCKNELSGGVDNDEAQVDDREADAYKEADEADKEMEDNSHTSMNRKLAMEKKNRKQEESAKKAMERCGKTALKSGILPGAVVTLQVDYRTHYNPEGLVAIVFDVQPRTGGIKVCCQHGVITHDGGKDDYWVPADKYIVKAPVGTFLPLPDDLAAVHVRRLKMVYSLKGNLNCLGFPTARCINFRSLPIVQSRNQRDAAARMGSAGRIVDARRRE